MVSSVIDKQDLLSAKMRDFLRLNAYPILILSDRESIEESRVVQVAFFLMARIWRGGVARVNSLLRSVRANTRNLARTR